MLMKTMATCLALGLANASAVLASDLEPVDLTPMDLLEAQLTVVSPDGTEISYTPEELEKFPTYRLVTDSPWRDEPAVFEGVRLSDILTASGLQSADEILVTAENDYQTVIAKTAMSEIPILVATRVDGAPHNRRARGPFQFIYHSDYSLSSDHASESLLVWMAARIEPR